MSKVKNDGGSAFPLQAAIQGNLYFDRELGMSLRAWFAGMALSGFMANKTHATTFATRDDVQYCCAIADAMIEELEKGKPNAETNPPS
jgi:hypothetical protein